jgi:hypothetical protein
MSAGASAGSSSRCRSSSSSSSSHGSSAEDARDAARRQAWFATVDRRQEQQEQLAASVEAGHTAVAAGQAAAAVVPVVAADFDSAGAFDGFRLGWVFKAGPNGLGYYRDYGPDADGGPKAAPLTPTASSAASAELFGYLDAARSHAGRGGDGGAGAGEVMWGLDTAAAAGVGGVKLGALARAEDGLLGRGAQSQVLLYRHLDPPPGFRGMLQYGVKAIAKAGLSARAASRALEEKAALAAAAAAWAGRPGKSPIVRLCGTGQDETALYLITEFLSKGTLTELAPVPPSLARYYVGALAVALEQSHALGFVHRDIKLDNVLLDGDAVPRLIDFGLCRRLRRGERASSLVGTLGCAAPEVLAGLPYGHAAEWWSVGVALHHLLLGAPPFDPGAGPAMEPVSHFCACIGSLCLRQCVHGASIGRMGCAGQPRGAGELGGAHERWRACGDAGRQRAAHPARVRG